MPDSVTEATNHKVAAGKVLCRSEKAGGTIRSDTGKKNQASITNIIIAILSKMVEQCYLGFQVFYSKYQEKIFVKLKTN